MKTKHLLFALAAPMFVVACTNEELVENASIVQNTGEEVSTEDLVLKAGFGAESRMSFSGSTFKWILDKSATPTTDQLGLCLSLDGKAQTNYKFTVNSLWSNAGNQYEIDGGNFSPAAPKAGDTDVTINDNIATAPLADFVTENATIFGGTYVAYYPYNESFKDASATIPVKVETIQDAGNLSSNTYVGKYAFYVSEPFQITGGQTVADFSMKQVLPILRFDLTNKGTKNVSVSKIEVSAEGGMPVVAGIDANLTSAVTLSNIHIDAEKNVASQLLVVSKALNAGNTGNKASAYMVVMPGTYKNLVVKAIMDDGAYITKTIETATLGLNNLQPITIDLNSDEMNVGNVYNNVTSETDLKAALSAAAKSANGQIEINVIKPISVANFNSLYDATTEMAGAKITVKGEKITVTGASTGSNKGLKNVTFENDVEFQGALTTFGDNNYTLAGNTTFEGAVTVSDGTTLNIGGNATAEDGIKVGSNTSPATFNVLSGAILNMVGSDLTTENQNNAHKINIQGTLNLYNSPTRGSILSVPQANNEVYISGVVNVSNLSTITMTNGKWSVGNGTINNAGKITAADKVKALGPGQKAMSLVNTGSLSVPFTGFDWNKDKINITNNGTYTLTSCTTDNLEAIVKNDNNKYALVNGINVAITSPTTYTIKDFCLNMSKYSLLFNVGSGNSSTIKIPESKTWSIGNLTVLSTNAKTTTTLTIQPEVNSEVGSVNMIVNNLSVKGNEANHEYTQLIFNDNTNAKVRATIENVYVENAVLTTNNVDGNAISWKTQNTSGSSTIK